MKRNFFYKELTPAEVGNTGTHEVYVRLPNNFDHESFFGHSAIMNGSVMEVNFKALDITNGGKETVSLRFAYFINSNQEKRIPSLGPLFRSHNVKEGDIAYLESMINGTSITYKICFYKKGEIQINPSSIYFTQIERDSNIVSGLQQIFYGAPGTGKSHEIKEKTAAAEEAGRVIRTTFHPDSDYSTFVGAYKPTMSSSEKIYSADELITKLKEIKNTGTTYPCHKFSSKYWESLKDLSANEIKQILAACGFTEAYGVEVAKGVAIGQEYLNKQAEGKIIYAFVPQAFTKAYTTAWNTVEKVYLIIEEINRGNCAQIFGDLFQLLDRKAGFSEYPVDADSDLANHICEELKNSSRTDFPEGVKEGKKLVLPSNLYIWATMNTSDQSLFPIDSAFKRRWDWKYIPINPEKENWSIETSKGLFSWSSFLNEINREIGETMSSEDKKLGFYFCKAESDKISAEKFVSKVLFYVYNDVFKDYGFESKDFFKKNGKVMYFQSYYNVDGTINEENVIQFLNNLKIEKTSESSNQS